MTSNVLKRVVFFSKTDGASGHNLMKAEELLRTLDFTQPLGLNDLLELYHVKKYLDNDMFLTSWNDQIIGTYKDVVKKAIELTRQFFSSVDNGNLLSNLESIEFNNRKAFWELFNYFKTFQKIDSIHFVEVLEKQPNQLRYILYNKQIVAHFGNEIKSFMLHHDQSAELLLGQFEQHHDRERTPVHFPSSLNHSDIETIMLSYIKSQEPNLNYVRLIQNSNSNELKLTPKVKFQAKKKAQELNNSIVEKSNGMRMGVQVTFDKDQATPVKLSYNDGITEISFSEGYFNSLDGSEELFGVFSYVFGFIDDQGLITLLSRESDLGVLERTFMKSKNEYEIGFVFHRNAMLAFVQFLSFEHYLKRERNIRIEDIILNFITDVINPRLNNQKLRFNLPSEKSSTLEKIRTLAPEFEFLLKQYNNYVTDGIIDFELLEFTSTPMRLSELKSVVGEKYVYGISEKIQILKNCFYSDQSGLYYTDIYKDKYNNLYDLLTNENVQFDTFVNYQQDAIKYLIEEDYLELSVEGNVRIKQPKLLYFVGVLFRDGVISYWHYREEYRDVIDEMIQNGLLEVHSTLFSTHEVSYFNYYLNKKEYTNGLDLRNKYLHGSNSESEEEQNREYHILLILLVLVLLKIDDDITLGKISSGSAHT